MTRLATGFLLCQFSAYMRGKHMDRETKNISLVDFKAIDDGANGGFTAYATVFGELDDVGDIILQGAYTKTIPQFLKRGFIAQAHDWDTAIGMPVSAVEDKLGLLVETRYHSTEQAKAARIVTNERRSMNMDVAVSIGYEPTAQPIYILPKDYPSELPKYVRADLLPDALVKAPRFPKVRVLPELHLFEISLVQVPALQSALVVDAKDANVANATTPSVKGMFEEALQERTNNLWSLWDVLCCVLYRLHDMAEVALENGIAFDVGSLLDEALAEFNARVTAYVLGGSDAGDGGMGMGMGYAGQEAEEAGSVKERLGTGLHYTDQLVVLGYGIKSAIERGERKLEQRKQEGGTKEGRVLSSANVTELGSAADDLEILLGRIRKLLEASKPKPKDDGKQEEDDEEAKKEKEAARKGASPVDINRIIIEHLLIDARANGVPV